jgi:cyclophilin family peptidyl-prolyl cis-trans isomerase
MMQRLFILLVIQLSISAIAQQQQPNHLALFDDKENCLLLNELEQSNGSVSSIANMTPSQLLIYAKYCASHPHPEHVEALITALKKNQNNEILFAISQQDQTHLSEWISAYKDDKNNDVETIGWLGKCIRNEEDAKAYQDFKSQEGYALGIYYALRNGQLQSFWPLELIDILQKQLKLGSPIHAVCRAIKTIPAKQCPTAEIEHLLSLYSPDHWMNRMAIRMIGKCKTPLSAQVLTDIALNPTCDTPSILECLIQLKKYGASEKLVPLLRRKEEEIICLTLECLALQKIDNADTRAYIEHSQNGSSSMPCSIFWAQESYLLSLKPQEDNIHTWMKFLEEDNPYCRMNAFGTIYNCPDLFDELLAFVLKANSSTDLYYGTQCLLGMSTMPTHHGIQYLWDKNDEGIDALLYEYMREKITSSEEQLHFKKLILERVPQYTMPKMIETRNEALNTLALWGDTLELPKSYASAMAWTPKELAALPHSNRYMLITQHDHKTDTLTFIVYKSTNPLTALHFSRLVAAEFYDHKFFHRRVSNFVLQGGCPRGDGMGSLDYTIASEFSTSHFEKGSIGWASAGPHTESCQIFFMLDEGYNLDGRYTNMGEITSGIDQLNTLPLGTEILSIRRLN